MNINLKNQKNSDICINNKIKMLDKTYTIVGQGYTYLDYLNENKDPNEINVYMFDSTFHKIFVNGSNNRRPVNSYYYLNISLSDEYNFAEKIKVYMNYYSLNGNNGQFYNFNKIVYNNLNIKLVKFEMKLFSIFGILTLI